MRYHFHIRDGDVLIEDSEGSELPSLDAAHAEAIAGARSILAEKLKAGEVLDGQRFEIVDGSGTLRAVVPLKDAIKLA